MKNILIITTTRDNQGSSVSFVESIDDIVEDDLREMIMHSILETKDWTKGDLWCVEDVCGSNDRGYVFNDYAITKLPITVEHIIDYVF